MSRIDPNDSLPTALMKMSDGNPGAVSVLLQCVQTAPAIDPSNLFGGFGSILLLDTYSIYGSNIWVLYKDVCSEHIGNMIAVLRATQLGIISHQDLANAIAHSRAPLLDPKSLANEVKKQIHDFNVEG